MTDGEESKMSGNDNWTPKPARGPEDHPHVDRPPFAKDNLAALKIGSRSPRVYGPVAERITEDLLESAPHLAAFPEELAALASAEAIVALMRIDLAGRGIRTKDGVERLSFLDRYFRAEAAASKRRDAMGLSPIGEAVLARERASAAAIASSVDLDALAARGREALSARVDIVTPVLEEAQARYAAERQAAAVEYARANSTTVIDSDAANEHDQSKGE